MQCEMKKIQRIMMVDDDPYCHLICKNILRRMAGEIEFIEFTSAEDGLQYIQTAALHEADKAHTILLLDINMPIMNGWEFLEKYEMANSEIKDRFTIYLLSSSVDPQDKERAATNKHIKDFLMKPFKKEMVEVILDGERIA